ncbi:hypothetical protein ANCCEY_04998 [Ancylostoma ceylanicum]|uniref:Peptidase M1 membrane alanine aminopeptidase domain-containing protein n=1 Tax=Ancylostoma ceylanicum TaxID=53326 RepID=A0A0D6LXG8_9BILA|nr:hypothetical protein ANCCEY_04998 [Ancylostoma ceylanicum]
MVALPDFCAGAMENWGLITFRENFLLVYGRPNIVHTSQITVAHELAHQWFGNMVTLKDWNEVWLKEGFAKYFENTMLDNKIDNGLNLYGDLATMDFEKALEKDSFATSHPLCSSIETASEVYESFDDISYSKGSAIIAMTLKIVGEKKFKEGLNKASTYGRNILRKGTEKMEKRATKIEEKSVSVIEWTASPDRLEGTLPKERENGQQFTLINCAISTRG